MEGLWKKLRMDRVEGRPKLLLQVPRELEALFQGLDAVHREKAQDRYPFIRAFVRDRAQAQLLRPLLGESLEEDGLLWVAYPKKSSKVLRSDLDRGVLWDYLGDYGYEPVAQVALDEDWSVVRYRSVAHIPTLTRKRRATAP